MLISTVVFGSLVKSVTEELSLILTRRWNVEVELWRHWLMCILTETEQYKELIILLICWTVTIY